MNRDSGQNFVTGVGAPLTAGASRLNYRLDALNGLGM
jgi:hypothetical protein